MMMSDKISTEDAVKLLGVDGIKAAFAMVQFCEAARKTGLDYESAKQLLASCWATGRDDEEPE